MKKIIFFLLAFPLFFAASAQTTDSDTSMNKTAVAVCDCLTKSNITDKSSQEDIQQAFLGCILKSAPDFMTKIASSEDPTSAGQELATKLAMQMMKNGCPAFTKLATAMMGNGNDTMQMEMPMQMQSKVETTQSIDGIVTKVEEKDFTYITVKSSTGRELTFMYYEYVPGSDDWIKDAVNKLKNKNVSLTYVETEVYQPKFKQFMNIKEIKTLTVK
ncbi:MAG: hypothetical protein ABJB05_10060 [Parafilimonas sp.]